MKCRNCGEKKGKHPHFDYPADLYCADCMERDYELRVEQATQDLLDFRIEVGREEP